MKKVLITGSNGFVGTNLRRHLAGKVEILTLDVSNADYGWNDLKKIPWSDVDAVVHLAGKAHDLKKVTDEKSYFEINVGLTERLWEAMGEGEGVFIYFSSIKAAEVDDRGLLPNGSVATPYARSKWAAEQYLLSHPPPSLPSRSSPRSLFILRPAMIHGPGNKGNLNLLWGIARRGFPWPLAAFENRRSFTSIGNICAVVEAIIHSPSLNVVPQISNIQHQAVNLFPIADDEAISTNRIIELIAEVCGKRAKLWRLPKGLMKFAAMVGDALHLPLNTERLGKLTEDNIVDNTAIKTALGWAKMPIRAEEGLRTTLRHFAEKKREKV